MPIQATITPSRHPTPHPQASPTKQPTAVIAPTRNPTSAPSPVIVIPSPTVVPTIPDDNSNSNNNNTNGTAATNNDSKNEAGMIVGFTFLGVLVLLFGLGVFAYREKFLKLFKNPPPPSAANSSPFSSPPPLPLRDDNNNTHSSGMVFPPVVKPTDEKPPICDVFISLRFAESLHEAKFLKSALEKEGLSVFLCAVPNGLDIKEEIVRQMHGCVIVVIMGSRTYGLDTGSSFGTKQEMEYVVGRKKRKPFFLIKMCVEFEVPQTDFNFPESIMYSVWYPGEPMPEGLVNDFMQRFLALKAIGVTTGGGQHHHVEDEKNQLPPVVGTSIPMSHALDSIDKHVDGVTVV